MLYSVLALYVALPIIYGAAAVEGSVHMSKDGMISLLNVESDLLQNFEGYINDLEQKASRMRRTLDIMRSENTRAKTNENDYVANPINRFSLIRRLHEDWIKWESFMSQPIGQERIEFIQNIRSKLPDTSDLSEASLTMHRLQVTYDLVPLDLTKGLLHKLQYNTKLSPQDAFRIGSELFNYDAFYAGYWLYGALEAYDDKNYIDPIHEFNKLTILELYSKTLQRQNRWNDSLLVIDIALHESPNNEKFLNYRLEVKDLIKKNYVHKEEPKEIYTPETTFGCQGLYKKQPSQLFCLYNSTTNAFLKLAPLKMEIIHMDPYMVIYHDVISDNEMELMKNIAIPQLQRAVVDGFEKGRGKAKVTKIRTAQVTGLPDDLNDLTKTLNRRIADMTGFVMMDSEELQAINYDLGGHYDSHYDHYNIAPNDERGNRIATVLFYLNDVEQGGGTVFPLLTTLLVPQKGTAVIWHNLDNRGNGNEKTLHAGCPVLVGSKWICTKWIAANPQLFTKPCYKE